MANLPDSAEIYCAVWGEWGLEIAIFGKFCCLGKAIVTDSPATAEQDRTSS